MVRINPDPNKASKQIVLFGNRQAVRFYEHEERADGTINYHKFWFHPDDITPWVTGIKPWISTTAPGDYEEDPETKKRYIVKTYEDRYVLPFPSDEKQTLFVLLTDFYGEKTEAAQKIDRLLRKMDFYQSEIASLQDDNSQLQSKLRQGEEGWRERLMKDSKVLQELGKNNKTEEQSYGGPSP